VFGAVVTSAILTDDTVVATVVVAKFAEGEVIDSAVVTGAVDDLAAVVLYSAVVNCFGFISVVVSIVIGVGALVRCAVDVSTEVTGIVVFSMVVAGVFVVRSVVAGVVVVSTSVCATVVFSAVLTGDTAVATVVSGIELFMSLVTGNLLVSAVVSTVIGDVGLTILRRDTVSLVRSSIPGGVAVTWTILCAAAVAVAVAARAAIVSAVVTGDVDDLAAVVTDSAVVKCVGFMSAVFIGVVVVGKLVRCAVGVSAEDRWIVVFLRVVFGIFVVASVVARVVVL